jgi:membrane protease YdiL (CAAX protease family)
VLAVLLTEEGFFRGWLWASLKRARKNEHQLLIWSSIAFTLWHVSPVVLDTGYNPPAPQVPVYLVNVFVIGVVWGLLRQISGSVLVASVCHGVWNGLTYALFGFGDDAGALGIEPTAVLGPEVGIVGLALNLVFAVVLWWWWVAHRSRPIDGS